MSIYKKYSFGHSLLLHFLLGPKAFQSSLARVSVDNQILAPLKNLLSGVPRMLRRQRFPTGENGKEEGSSSGLAEVSSSSFALKYIRL